MDFLAANHVRIVGFCGQNKAHRAVIFAIAQLSCYFTFYRVCVCAYVCYCFIWALMPEIKALIDWLIDWSLGFHFKDRQAGWGTFAFYHSLFRPPYLMLFHTEWVRFVVVRHVPCFAAFTLDAFLLHTTQRTGSSVKEPNSAESRNRISKLTHFSAISHFIHAIYAFPDVFK